MDNIYQVAGLRFAVSGKRLCKVVESIDGFHPFLAGGEDVLFSFVEGCGVPEMKQVEYSFVHEGVSAAFGRTEAGFLLTLRQQDGKVLDMWHDEGTDKVFVCGELLVWLCRFAMWIGVGLMFAPYNIVAIHGSCVVCRGKAVLFLGESGTGKSTHTRLWQEYVEGSFLLNDDSPFLRIEEGRVWAYGSPWSGKTPCYRQERYELKGCVRLSQAPHNQMKRLSILPAYGAVHPSCPPAFACDEVLYDHISDFISGLLSTVPCYHLECLPDRDAAMLSFKTMFSD